MCGIAGFVLKDGEADVSQLAAMCGAIRHRGPDDEGFYVDGGCAVGMRRLSIIDLQTGHQPLSNEDGSVWVVFNGEIYDYQSVRRRLMDQGHQFRTASDTEVLVHLYEQEGAAGVERLRGMFAFAIWDARQRRLMLARDRFGKKPLYYARLPHGFYFASELKSLRLADIPLDIDRQALRLYLQFGYIPDPYTPFESVRRLPAGSWLTLDADGAIDTGRYWRVPATAPEPPKKPEETIAAEVRSSFDEAVRIRMVADVPLGAFLSGGIDSSSVVASMALQSKEPVKTFSIGFEEGDFNELKYAAMVAKKYSTEHHELIVRPDAVGLVERLVRHFDEPFADTAAIPTFVVSEFAAQHVKVVLTGDGGDELFGGYDSFRQILARQWMDAVPHSVRRGISAVADWLPYSAYGKNYLKMMGAESALDRYFESNYTPFFLRRSLVDPEWMIPPGASYLVDTLDDCFLPDEDDALTQAINFEATANLAGDMLVKVDRMSMANSLEVRCPLLDHEVAELAFSIPISLKIRGGRGKYILVKALGDRLPRELLDRPKMGFGVPLASWFKGPLRDMLQSHLTSPRFLNRGIVSPSFVRAMLNEHQSGRRDNHAQLWSLLMLELWFATVEQGS